MAGAWPPETCKGRDVMNRKTIYGFVAGAVLLTVLPVAQGWAFGTVSKVPILGQDAEHEKITRAALSMFEAKTLDELAGTSNTFGAVGAPDDPARDLLFTDDAHCDNGDYLEPPAGQVYRQTREEAKAHLVKCREWMAFYLDRAVEYAGQLAKPDEQNTALPCGAFVGIPTGNAKCKLIEDLGVALHASEDFYSHTNWVDKQADGPVSANNPPGLGHVGRAPWLDLRRETPFPEGLISGCFTALPEAIFCNNWGGPTPVKHDYINKDKGQLVNGVPGAGITDRGKVNDNFALAVNAAIADTRDKWAYFEERVRAAYGSEAQTILCAIRRDDYRACAEDWRLTPDVGLVADAAPGAGALVEAREMLSDLQRLAEQATQVAHELQQSCTAGQAIAPKLEADVAAADGELRKLEAAQAGQKTQPNVAAAKAAAREAASTADTAGRNVARAREIARRQSDVACRLSTRIVAAKVDGSTDIDEELHDTQFAAEQTDSALRMARTELARAKAAEQRAQAALAGLTPQASVNGDALKARLVALTAPARELTTFAASITEGRKERLAPLVESAKPIFKEAGERIDAGATGEELEVLKQVRQAYLPIADADEALARCANVMAATATATQSRLSGLSERATKLGGSNASPVASNRDMAAIRDAAEDATASVAAAEVFLAPIGEFNDRAQDCLAKARNAGNKVLAQRNEASATCTRSYPGSVVTGFKSGKPQCNCPSGWSWNLADKACITSEARRVEEQRACTNLPGSVFDSIDPADNRARCACPDGMDWNDRRTACERIVARGDSGANDPTSAPGDAFGNALANIVTQLAQANNASNGGGNGGGGYSTPNTGNAPAGGGFGALGDDGPDDWGIFLIGAVNDSPEVVHGSKAKILAMEGGGFVGLGRSSETVQTLVNRGEWKFEEVSRASSYEECNRQFEALYAKATPSRFWGPFIRIDDKLIHKYNNPRPYGAPRR